MSNIGLEEEIKPTGTNKTTTGYVRRASMNRAMNQGFGENNHDAYDERGGKCINSSVTKLV